MTIRTRTSISYRPLHPPRTPKPHFSLAQLIARGSVIIIRKSQGLL